MVDCSVTETLSSLFTHYGTIVRSEKKLSKERGKRKGRLRKRKRKRWDHKLWKREGIDEGEKEEDGE